MKHIRDVQHGIYEICIYENRSLFEYDIKLDNTIIKGFCGLKDKAELYDHIQETMKDLYKEKPSTQLIGE